MIDLILSYVLPAAYDLMPPACGSAEAAVMLVAIGLQESRFAARRQHRGPARGFWQFEAAGVEGVLRHRRAGPLVRGALAQLRYARDADVAEIHGALEHNDVLAAVVARALLWSDPAPLPDVGPDSTIQEQADPSWDLYRRLWRPGRPVRASWDALYAEAWARVNAGRPPAF